MKSRRFQYEYRKSASKLHKAVGEALRSYSLFSGYRSYQEYPVNKVNPSYESGREHFDWVIPDLHLVIECHGEQHYTPVAFDGDQTAAIDRFNRTQELDDQKKNAAINAGYVYMVVKYDELKQITGELLWDRYTSILEAGRALLRSLTPKNKSKMYYDKEKAREYRKAKYQRFKEWKRQKKEGSYNGSKDNQTE